jgi:hypothetical protein
MTKPIPIKNCRSGRIAAENLAESNVAIGVLAVEHLKFGNLRSSERKLGQPARQLNFLVREPKFARKSFEFFRIEREFDRRNIDR